MSAADGPTVEAASTSAPQAGRSASSIAMTSAVVSPCAARAFELMAPYSAKGDYQAAVIVMTNGGSAQSPQFESQWRSVGREIPVYGVTFGKANRETLDELARLPRAQVFDGPTQSAAALQTARGYN